MQQIAHQYIDRQSGRLESERLYQDRLVMFFYSRVRESMPAMFRMLTSRRSTTLLGYLNYDTRWGSGACRRFLRDNGIPSSGFFVRTLGAQFGNQPRRPNIH